MRVRIKLFPSLLSEIEKENNYGKIWKYKNNIYIFIFARYILYRLICRSFFFTFSHYIISIWITNPYYIRLHDCWFVGYQHWEHCDAEMICRNVHTHGAILSDFMKLSDHGTKISLIKIVDIFLTWRESYKVAENTVTYFKFYFHEKN